MVILEQYLRLSRPHCRHTSRRKGSQSGQQSGKARSALRHRIPETWSRAWWVCIPRSVWGHLQLLDLGGSHRQPLVQGRTFGEETGLPLPEVDALSVVPLTPGVGHGCRHVAKACLARELEKASHWQGYLDCELNQVMDTIGKERACLETSRPEPVLLEKLERD